MKQPSQENQQQQEQKQGKVPMIRLKLKVPNTAACEPVNMKETLPIIKSADTMPKFYGTFKYRPFKLFPLLPPASRYRVLIPSKHTRFASNPAIKLDYFWVTRSDTGLYTDDSDLLCVVLKEGWAGAEVEGKSLLVEVEVVDKEGRPTEDSLTAAKDEMNSRINDPTQTNDTPTHPKSHPLVTPRVYPSEHHGHFIRVTSCTVNPSAVHLKRWRKRKTPLSSHLVTPNFKTNS